MVEALVRGLAREATPVAAGPAPGEQVERGKLPPVSGRRLQRCCEARDSAAAREAAQVCLAELEHPRTATRLPRKMCGRCWGYLPNWGDRERILKQA